MANSISGNGEVPTTIIERRSIGTGMTTLLIVAIALFAAIAFFLFAKESREDRGDEAATMATQSVDDAAEEAQRLIGDAEERFVPKE